MTNEAFQKIFDQHLAEVQQLEEENRKLKFTLEHTAKSLAWWEDLFQSKSQLVICEYIRTNFADRLLSTKTMHRDEDISICPPERA